MAISMEKPTLGGGKPHFSFRLKDGWRDAVGSPGKAAVKFHDDINPIGSGQWPGVPITLEGIPIIQQPVVPDFYWSDTVEGSGGGTYYFSRGEQVENLQGPDNYDTIVTESYEFKTIKTIDAVYYDTWSGSYAYTPEEGMQLVSGGGAGTYVYDSIYENDFSYEKQSLFNEAMENGADHAQASRDIVSDSHETWYDHYHEETDIVFSTVNGAFRRDTTSNFLAENFYKKKCGTTSTTDYEGHHEYTIEKPYTRDIKSHVIFGRDSLYENISFATWSENNGISNEDVSTTQSALWDITDTFINDEERRIVSLEDGEFDEYSRSVEQKGWLYSLGEFDGDSYEYSGHMDFISIEEGTYLFPDRTGYGFISDEWNADIGAGVGSKKYYDYSSTTDSEGTVIYEYLKTYEIPLDLSQSNDSPLLYLELEPEELHGSPNPTPITNVVFEVDRNAGRDIEGRDGPAVPGYLAGMSFSPPSAVDGVTPITNGGLGHRLQDMLDNPFLFQIHSLDDLNGAGAKSLFDTFKLQFNISAPTQDDPPEIKIVRQLFEKYGIKYGNAALNKDEGFGPGIPSVSGMKFKTDFLGQPITIGINVKTPDSENIWDSIKKGRWSDVAKTRIDLSLGIKTVFPTENGSAHLGINGTIGNIFDKPQFNVQGSIWWQSQNGNVEAGAGLEINPDGQMRAPATIKVKH